ncbi:MAG: hypothetical protein ACREYF_02815, partial [Gammaproteobacteria bacterium]
YLILSVEVPCLGKCPPVNDSPLVTRGCRRSHYAAPASKRDRSITVAEMVVSAPSILLRKKSISAEK